MKSIFVSRQLHSDSQLLLFLEANKWTIHHFSLIKIEAIPFKIEGQFDWIFLSSSNAVLHLFHEFIPDESTRFAAVGSSTAAALERFGFRTDFIGDSGDMNLVGSEFASMAGTGKILFAGAEGGSEIVRSKLSPGQVNFVPIYRTIVRTDLQIPQTDLAFLTSPSNAKAYVNCAQKPAEKIIPIGNTTANYLRSQGLSPVAVPRSPSEMDLIKVLTSL